MRKVPTVLGATAAAALLLSSAAPATAAAPAVSVKSTKVAYGGEHVRVVFYVTCPKGEDYVLKDELYQETGGGYEVGQGVPCTGKRQTLSTTVWAQEGFFLDDPGQVFWELYDTQGDMVLAGNKDVTVEYVGIN